MANVQYPYRLRRHLRHHRRYQKQNYGSTIQYAIKREKVKRYDLSCSKKFLQAIEVIQCIIQDFQIITNLDWNMKSALFSNISIRLLNDDSNKLYRTDRISSSNQSKILFYLMIRHLSTAIQRQVSLLPLFKSGVGRQGSFIKNPSFTYKGMMGFTDIKNMPAVHIDIASPNGTNLIVEDQIKQKPQKDPTSNQNQSQKNNNHQDGTCKQKKSGFKRLWQIIYKFIKNTIIKLLGYFSAFYAFIQYLKDSGLVGIFMKEWKQNEQINFKVKKGLLLQKDLQQNKNYKCEQQETKSFQCINIQQEKDIKNILQYSDNKVVQYIQAFSGNGLATNMIRYIARENDNIQKGKKNPREQKQKSKDQNEAGQKKKKKKKIKLYYYDLKQPPGHLTIQDSGQNQLLDLHYFLTSLIKNKQQQQKKWPIQKWFNEKIRKKQKQEQLLIINNVQFLDSSHIKTNKLEQLFKQIIHVNKQKIAKIILISGNHYFYDSCLKKLKCVDIQEYKKQCYKQLNDKDLKEVIKYRMAYTTIKPILSPEKQGQIDKIIDQIVDSTDSVKQCMRILKTTKLDAKDFYGKHIKKVQKSKHNDKFLQKILTQQFAPSLLKKKLWDSYGVVVNECKAVIKVKQDHLQKSIGISDYKDVDYKTAERLKLIQKYKIELLNDILNKKYEDQKNEAQFYLDYNDAKLQAFRQLNNDVILHGFEFVSKSTKLAFEKARKEHPQYFQRKQEKANKKV